MQVCYIHQEHKHLQSNYYSSFIMKCKLTSHLQTRTTRGGPWYSCGRCGGRLSGGFVTSWCRMKEKRDNRKIESQGGSQLHEKGVCLCEYVYVFLLACMVCICEIHARTCVSLHVYA